MFNLLKVTGGFFVASYGSFKLLEYGTKKQFEKNKLEINTVKYNNSNDFILSITRPYPTKNSIPNKVIMSLSNKHSVINKSEYSSSLLCIIYFKYYHLLMSNIPQLSSYVDKKIEIFKNIENKWKIDEFETLHFGLNQQTTDRSNLHATGNQQELVYFTNLARLIVDYNRSLIRNNLILNESMSEFINPTYFNCYSDDQAKYQVLTNDKIIIKLNYYLQVYTPYGTLPIVNLPIMYNNNSPIGDHLSRFNPNNIFNEEQHGNPYFNVFVNVLKDNGFYQTSFEEANRKIHNIVPSRHSTDQFYIVKDYDQIFNIINLAVDNLKK